MAPTLTLVVPTKDRPGLLRAAVDSALGQDIGPGELAVVVVDDGSADPATLPGDPRLRVLRHPVSRGGAAARNTGLAAVAGPLVGYLDDDDELTPDHAARCLAALAAPDPMPGPVGVLTGVDVVGPDGTVTETRLPPTLPRGRSFALEPRQPGRSFSVKQTLVAPVAAVRAAGGWDERFRSRVHTDLFLRLNPVCSLRGLDAVTYRLRVHPGPRVSGNPRLRRDSFRQLLDVHAAAFAAHPARAAELFVDHARTARLLGLPGEAAWAWARAVRTDPRGTTAALRHSAAAEVRARRGAPRGAAA